MNCELGGVAWDGLGTVLHECDPKFRTCSHIPAAGKKETQLHLTSDSFRIGMGQTYNDPKKCYDALKRFLGWSPIYRAISEIFEPMNGRKSQGTCRNEGSLD